MREGKNLFHRLRLSRHKVWSVFVILVNEAVPVCASVDDDALSAYIFRLR